MLADRASVPDQDGFLEAAEPQDGSSGYLKEDWLLVVPPYLLRNLHRANIWGLLDLKFEIENQDRNHVA